MFKKNRTLLEKLKALRPYMLDGLPELIQVNDTEQNIENATLDQIAFAILALENEIRPLSSRMHALRELYDLARKHGALGEHRIAEIFAKTEGKL